MDSNVICGCTGPDEGLTRLDLHSTPGVPPPTVPGVCQAKDWNNPFFDCIYGISLSLYEENTGTELPTAVIGDPIADVYGGVVRGNNCVLAVADGVSWGRKPRLAARCAVRGAIEFISRSIDNINEDPSSTTIFSVLKNSLLASQESIISNRATLTTLSVVITCRLANSPHWGVFVACVGDSPVFVYSTRLQSVIELTAGSNPSDGIRNPRMSGGSLGPALGSEPDLANLTYSFIPVMKDDMIILMTDGVSDNLMRSDNEASLHAAASNNLTTIIRDHHESVIDNDSFTAQSVTALLMSKTVEMTEEKRKFNAHCMLKGIPIKSRARVDEEFAETVRNITGKLDHATVLTYQIP